MFLLYFMRNTTIFICVVFSFSIIFQKIKAQSIVEESSFDTETIKEVPLQMAQNSDLNGKTVSFSQFIKALTKQYFDPVDNSKIRLQFTNITIQFDDKEDRPFMDKRFTDPNAPIWYCVHAVGFDNITIQGGTWWVMNNFVFKEFVTISQFSNMSAIFKDCIFEKTLRITKCQIIFLGFENCKFQHGFRYQLSELKEYVRFNNCTISLNPNIQDDSRMSLFNLFVREAHLFEFSQKGEPIDFFMNNCTFDIPKRNKNLPKYAINISETHFTNLQLVDNVFNANLNLAQATIENQFLFSGGQLNGSLIMDALNMNPLNTRVQWTKLSNNKISVYDGRKQLVNGHVRYQIKDEVIFANLISCYATFYGLFKSQGNRNNSNSCYVEWKDIETAYLYNQYQKDTRVSVYFAYLMNIFLRSFCDYGTNPLKSIYLSGLVLVFFAFLYFISPFQLNGDKDEEGKYRKRNVYTQLKLYASYFLEREKLKNIYLRQQVCKISNKDKEEFLTLTASNQNRLPFMFHVIAQPPIVWRKFKQRLEIWFYDRIDIVHDKWEDLGTFRRFWTSFVFSLLILFGICYFILARMIDAITLSLNVFSTLGFGEIPVQGTIRYLTVIEGFIGWFLLSIFSVSLISQVIQ
jgi:hypothetical protein